MVPGALVYQNMASASNSRASNSKITSAERVKEDLPALQKLQVKMGWMPPKQHHLPSVRQLPQACFNLEQQQQQQTLTMEIAKSRNDLNAEKRHYQSSGSEHEASSVCLAALVDEFMEDQAALGKTDCKDGYTKERLAEDCSSNLGGEPLEILKGLIACSNNKEASILIDVTKAVKAVKEQAGQICKEDGIDCTSGCLKRATMRHLRSAGYNAAICKSRWDHAGGFPGGDYEYIDILIDRLDGTVERLIVDIDFRGQFEIARPTDRYAAIFQELPQIFVGAPERLQQIVNLMCDAVKQSLKKRGMPLPPWRKPDYMRAKWFSAYKRTTNDLIQPHESSEVILSRELAHTAFRGSRWDSRFTNEMELQLLQGREAAAHSSNRNLLNEITAVMTEWKPPAVVQHDRRTPRVAGLAAVLYEAGLSTLAKQQQQQQQHKQQHQQQQVDSGACRKMSLVAVS